MTARDTAWLVYEENQQPPHNCSLQGLFTFTERSLLFSVNYSGYAGVGGGLGVLLAFQPDRSRQPWGVFTSGELGFGFGADGIAPSVTFAQTEATLDQIAGNGIGASLGFVVSGVVSMSLDGQCNVTRGLSGSGGGGGNISLSTLTPTLFTDTLNYALQEAGINDASVEETIRDFLYSGSN